MNQPDPERVPSRTGLSGMTGAAQSGLRPAPARPSARPKRAWRGYGLLALLFLPLLACAAPATVTGAPMIKDIQISPEGTMVAFMFCSEKLGRCSSGLLDLTSNEMIRIPDPPGRQLLNPSFSYDSTKLAAASYCAGSCSKLEIATSQIVVIDLPSLTVTEVTEGLGVKVERGVTGMRKFPVFQPGTDNILFTTQRVDSAGNAFRRGLNLVNVKTHAETVLLDPNQGFNLGIYRASFVGANEIIFYALSPLTPELKKAAEEIYNHPIQILPYSLRFGEAPQIIPPYPELLELGLLKGQKPHEIKPTTSKDGKRIAFVYLSSTVKTERWFNYEIYLREDGKVRQVTDLRGHLTWPHISYHGRYVAFLADNTRGRNLDLFILDLDTGIVKPTGLRDRLAADPAFQFDE